MKRTSTLGVVLAGVVLLAALAVFVSLRWNRPARREPPPRPELVAWRRHGRKLSYLTASLVPGSEGCRSFGDFDGDGRSECLAHGDFDEVDVCRSTLEVRRLTEAGFVGASLDAARDRPGSTLRFVTTMGDSDADGYEDALVAIQTCFANAHGREATDSSYAILTRFRILAGSAGGLTEHVTWEGVLPPMLFQPPQADRALEHPSTEVPHVPRQDAMIHVRREGVFDANRDGRPDVELSVVFRAEAAIQVPSGSFVLESAASGYTLRALGSRSPFAGLADFDGDGRRTPLRESELPLDAPPGFSDHGVFEGRWSAGDLDGEPGDELLVTRGGETWNSAPAAFDGAVVVFPASASGVRPAPVARIVGDSSNQIDTADFGAAQVIRLRQGSPCVLVPAIDRQKEVDVPPHAAVACWRGRRDGGMTFELVARLRGASGDRLEIVDIDGDGVDEVLRDRRLYRIGH